MLTRPAQYEYSLKLKEEFQTTDSNLIKPYFFLCIYEIDPPPKTYPSPYPHGRNHQFNCH